MTFPSHWSLSLILQLIFLAFVQGLSLPRQNHANFEMNEWGITWDQSCRVPNPKNESETKEQFIQRAWAGAIELGHSAWTRFEKTSDMLEKGPLSPDEQREVNESDPAYVQLFALDWSEAGVERIRSVLKALALRANADPGTNKRPGELKSAIDINCQDKWATDDGNQCENHIAFLNNKVDPDDDTEYATSTLNFCNRFWSLPRYDRLKAAAQVSNVDELDHRGITVADYMLVRRNVYWNRNYDGTDAGIVYHELSHLFWIGPTNMDNDDDICEDLDEIYGLYSCAETAWNHSSPVADNHRVTWNADTYQNYAEYGRFVELLGEDLWPDRLKPVKLPVHY